MMRLFVGIDLPPSLSATITEMQKILRKQELFVGTYPKEEPHHITLKFLGDIDEENIPPIAQALEKIHVPAPHARFDRLHTFSVDQRIRVIYCAVHCPALAELVTQLDTCLEPWVAPEQRSLVPHVTLAHVNSVQDQRQLLHALDALEISHSTFVIDSFCLKESSSAAEEAHYTSIQCYMLAQK